METLARKLIARAAGQPVVSAGDVVICKVDLAMIHDSGGPRRVKPMLERLGRHVWDKDRVVVVTDHYVPADTEETRAIQALTRKWVRDEDIANFYDQQGICHVVLPERGHLSPGMFCVGVTAIRRPAVPSVPICSASGRPRWQGFWQLVKSGFVFPKPY